MSFLLLIVMYTGEVQASSFKSAVQCEQALIEATDLGNRKSMASVECLESEGE